LHQVGDLFELKKKKTGLCKTVNLYSISERKQQDWQLQKMEASLERKTFHQSMSRPYAPV